MKKFYILSLLILVFYTSDYSLFANNNNEEKKEANTIIQSSDKPSENLEISMLLKSTVTNEQTIRTAVPTWEELKNREYVLKDFGLLDNNKSKLFIKVFMAKIKYIKRHVNDEGFIVQNNIPLNPETKKIDEKLMINNLKEETLKLLGFIEPDVIATDKQYISIFNPNK